MRPAIARQLLRRARSGALATVSCRDGAWPFASLVTLACDCDAAPIFLFSQLADHTHNLQADNRAALLIEDASHRTNPQTGSRISMLGRIEISQDERHRRRYLARHPFAAAYAGFADFAIYRMTIWQVHSVGGFAQACRIAGDEFCADLASAAAIGAAEPDILETCNADGTATRLARRLGRDEDGWEMIAVDPDGCDLRRGNTLQRLEFPRAVDDPEQVRAVLVEMTTEPRGDQQEL